MWIDRVGRVKFNVYKVHAYRVHFFILSVFTNVFDCANIYIGENNDNKTDKG